MKESIEFSDDCAYFVSYAMIPESVPSYTLYKHVAVGLVINYKTGIVEDASITFIADTAKSFLRHLALGYNVHENGIEGLIEIVKLKYNVASQKSVCVALRDVYKKYMLWREKNKF